MRLALLFLSVLFAASALSADVNVLSGKVVSVADGDTLTLLTHENEQIKVRLSDIDAPEKKQPFGQRSKQALSDLCFGKQAIIAVREKDRYKRSVARVYCGQVDANEHQVKSGMAWVYRQYSKDAALLEVEAEAKAAKRGLWSEPNPVSPWEFRKQRRNK
jgi:endonuclease YncB( thermonuclease family)